MLALRKMTKESGVSLISVPRPTPQAGDCLVRVTMASVCPTDWMVVHSSPPVRDRVRVPVTIGHEWCGTVVDVGPGVDKRWLGAYVTAEDRVFCNTCHACQHGLYHLCEQQRHLGINCDGSLAEYMVVPTRVLVRLPSDTPPEDATNMVFWGVSCHAVTSVDVKNQDLLIVGSGVMGLLAVRTACALGATSVDYITNHVHVDGAKRRLTSTSARVMSDDASCRDSLDVYDAVIVLSATVLSRERIIASCRAGHTIAALRMPEGDHSDWERFLAQGLTLKAVTGRRMPEDWNTMCALLASGFTMKDLCQGPYDMEAINDALNALVTDPLSRPLVRIARDVQNGGERHLPRGDSARCP